MRDSDNIRDISELAIDYLGFIFFQKSPRNAFGITDNILSILPERVTQVMVTVDMPEDELVKTAERYGFRILQLHGNESPEECEMLRSKGFTVWKALPIADGDSFKVADKYVGKIDAFLFDTAAVVKGGSGKKFDWKLLDEYKSPVDFMLSGGIDSGDEKDILEISHPCFRGIDINSRFEDAPALKNIKKVAEFITKLR